MNLAGRRTPSWQVAGKGVVTVAEMRRALLDDAYLVWRTLVRLRDDAKFAALHNTTALTAERIGLTAVQYKKALNRLRRFGLLHDIGWRYLKVFRGGITMRRKVFVREVRGARYKERPFLAVPLDSVKLVKEPPKRGGRRKGAGRPCKYATLQAVVQHLFHVEHTLALVVDQKSNGSESYMETPKSNRSTDLIGSRSSSPDQSGHAFLSEKPDAPAVAALSSGASDLSSSPGQVQESEGAYGARLAGHGQPWIPSLAMEGLPPYPSYEVVKPAVVPAPPQINADYDDRQAALFLLKCYRGAYHARYDEPCPVRLEWLENPGARTSGLTIDLRERGAEPTPARAVNGEITRFQHYEELVTAAKLLRTKGIAPAAWCAFSIDTWQKYGPKAQFKDANKRASVYWTFSPKRIEERSGWFSSEYSRYSGGTAIFGRMHKELLQRYGALRMALRPRMTLDERRALVERYFPRGRYNKLVEAARDEAFATEQDLYGKVERGVFVW